MIAMLALLLYTSTALADPTTDGGDAEYEAAKATVAAKRKAHRAAIDTTLTTAPLAFFLPVGTFGWEARIGADDAPLHFGLRAHVAAGALVGDPYGEVGLQGRMYVAGTFARGAYVGVGLRPYVIGDYLATEVGSFGGGKLVIGSGFTLEGRLGVAVRADTEDDVWVVPMFALDVGWSLDLL